MNNKLDMTQGNLLKKIIQFSLPLMATGILQLLYNAADVVVIGQFSGKSALAAVGSTGALINLIVNLFFGLSVGFSYSFAKSIGMKDENRANTCVGMALSISIVSSIVLMAIGIPCASIFLKWMKSPDDVIGLASSYVRIYFCGIFFNLLYNFFAAIFRAYGDTKRPLIVLSISGIINVILNLIFVIIFKMSVSGVAIATIISQMFSAIALFIILLKEKGPLKLDLKNIQFNKTIFKEILICGIPSGLQGMMFSISNVLIQSSINTFGTTMIAANSTAGNIDSFVYISMNGISQSAINFSSQNYGAGNVKNIKKVCLYTSILVFTVGEFVGGIVILLGKYLCRLYTQDSEVIQDAQIRLFWLCFIYGLCGWNEVLVGCTRGIGKSLNPMITSILTICVYRIIWIYTIFEATKSIQILYASYPISWVLACVAQLISFIIYYKKYKKKQEEFNVIA